MPNEPAQRLPRRLRKGQMLTAHDMNLIVNALLKRIEGGRGITIRTFGRRIVIETSNV